MSGDLIALPIALGVVAYHYGITRDVRRTLHRMAEALERRSAPEPLEQHGHVDDGDDAGH